ncbi:MAG: AraC family transcriptional regulator [Lentisphaeraceae bacterium]|nr:AraC family transcriptional regulator [Lentisphaeraceae bacterium]
MKIENPELLELVERCLALDLSKLYWVKRGEFRNSLSQQTAETRKIIILLEGKADINSSSGALSLAKGEGFILDPYAWYEIEKGDFESIEIVICGSRIEIYEGGSKVDSIDKKMHVLLRCLSESRREKVDEIYSLILKHKDEEESAERAVLFKSILLHIVKLFNAPPVTGKRLRQVFETLIACVIDNYLNQNFTRLAVSAKFDISESYINTMISWGLGCKFKEFLTIKRLEYSRLTLKESKMQIKALAPLFGYADATIYIINFRQRYKLTPNKMREIMNREQHTDEERRILHHMNKLEELASTENLTISDDEINDDEKTLLFLSNMTNEDISVFACGDNRTFLRNIPENSRVIMSAPRGGVLEIKGEKKDTKQYKVAEKPCIVYFS